MRRVHLVVAPAAAVLILNGQPTPSPQPSVETFPVLWLAVGGGLAVAALILYVLHVRRL